MGAACCCLRDDWEDFSNPNRSIHRNCICLHCFMRNLLYLYASLFHRGEERALPSPTQGAVSLSSSASIDNSLADMFRAPPRPLPYDADPRYYSLQRDGLISRREKGSSHAHEETEPLRTSEDDEESESMSKKNKWNELKCDNASKENNSKSSLKLSTAKSTAGFAHIYNFSDDEDVCPTCLEEYTKENPKIVTDCSHHFHLGCIYEWMERSDNCPVCGKVPAICPKCTTHIIFIWTLSIAGGRDFLLESEVLTADVNDFTVTLLEEGIGVMKGELTVKFYFVMAFDETT